MNKQLLTRPGLDPVVQRFLDELNSLGGKPIYEMTPTEARQVLVKIQRGPINLPPVDISDHTISGGPKGKISIRMIRPKGNTALLPPVVYFHGGGWILGDHDTHDRLTREIANRAQAAVLFVGYDPSPEAQFPVPLEEAYAALSHVAQNGAEFNVDAAKLAVAGDSVGGNMATVMTLMAKERGGPKINYQVLFYPVTSADMTTDSYKQFKEGFWLTKPAMEWFWDAYLPDKSARQNPLASPLRAPESQLQGLPPALIITAECDVLRDEGEAYAHRLMQAGVPTTSVRFLGVIHDFVMLNALAETPAVRSAIELATVHLCKAFASSRK